MNTVRKADDLRTMATLMTHYTSATVLGEPVVVMTARQRNRLVRLLREYADMLEAGVQLHDALENLGVQRSAAEEDALSAWENAFTPAIR